MPAERLQAENVHLSISAVLMATDSENDLRSSGTRSTFNSRVTTDVKSDSGREQSVMTRRGRETEFSPPGCGRCVKGIECGPSDPLLQLRL